MKNIALLNAIESKYYFDNLLIVASNPALAWQDKIRQLNTTFLSVVNTLTEQREKQIFTGWFAKINFICQAYSLGNSREEELQALRRLLRRTLTQNKLQITEGQFLKALQILSSLITFFSDEKIPKSLADFFENRELPSIIFKEKLENRLEVLYAIILEKSEIEYDKQGKGQIQLTCDTEDYGTVQLSITDIHFYNPTNGNIFRKYELTKHCAFLTKAYQTLCFTNLEMLSENHFASTQNTLLIASPDYLVDATAIANCFMGNAYSPYLYLLNKLNFFQGNEHTFAGKLINDVLDNYIESGEEDFDTLFKKVFAESQVEAATLQLSKEQISDMYYKIKPQFATIQKALQNYLHRQVISEPTFISGKYGLQGRIDLLVEYPDNKERKDIIELKATSYTNAQFEIARRDHLLQVACYNLLIDSTFEGRKGVSAILYSKDVLSPLRDCGKLNFQEQDAMWLRNCIVYIDLKMSRAEESFFEHFIQKLKSLNLPPYKQIETDAFIRKWEHADELDKAYFSEFMALTAREMLVAKVGGVSGNEPGQGFASLWRSSLTEKQENFVILAFLKIKEIDTRNNEITFLRPSQNEVSAFRSGDIVVLYPIENSEELKPHQYQLLKGNLIEVHPDRIKMKIWNKAVDKNFFAKYSQWAIEPNLMESNFNAQFASLSVFLGADKAKKLLLYGLQKPEFEEKFFVDYSHTLSKEQNRILNKALSAKDYFLLQGPPGTGKTSKMLRSMVDYLYNQTAEAIVLLAYTNRATDEICQKIEEVCLGNYIRLGNMQEENVFWDKNLKSEPDLETISRKLANNRIFVSTVSSFYNNLHLIKQYDTLIVDEASQLLEPGLCGILPLFKRFFLIGDEKQLPAVVIQAPNFCKTENQKLNEIGIKDLSTSVFERLVENALGKGWLEAFDMLSVQYRTHEDIAAFISKEFYHTLKIGSNLQKLALTIYNPQSEDENEKLLAASRLLFIPSERENNLKFHKAEAQITAKLLQTIRKVYQKIGNFNSETVGVITPYRAQIAEIYKLMDNELREMVTVDTVERYQGSERDIIIISMAVNHPAQMKNLQAFNPKMTVDKKLNVALSRAKEQLILLGNPEILKEGLFYQKFLSYLVRKGR